MSHPQQAGRELIPVGTLTKPPSAELKEDQTDQDSLPPYEVLDPILHLYVEQEQSVSTIVAQGFDEQTVRDVARRVDGNEYKRKQAPVALKVQEAIIVGMDINQRISKHDLIV